MNHGKSTSEEVQGDAFPGNAHDPLCPVSQPADHNSLRLLLKQSKRGREALERASADRCRCDEYAEVRAEEREKAAKRAQDPSLHSHWCVLARPYQTPDDVCDCEHADVIAAVRGES